MLTHELYALAAREPAFRDLIDEWMGCSQQALERHFDPETARQLDALIAGLTIHRALGSDCDPDVAADAVRRLTGG